MNLQKSNNNKNKFDSFIRYSGLGFEMLAIIALGTFGGYKLDQWLKTDFNWFTLILMVFSVVISIFYGVRNLLKK
ncbi:MAG: AtpZ/AtpI family protein [Prolixibacteraceae bacterium]|nr:AtpZ/AtpI family protein [Prolixibacteraceae bacterium]MBN2773849.1 AtpZ/AtpI family protein [Prolixibacteraceae bacterium]